MNLMLEGVTAKLIRQNLQKRPLDAHALAAACRVTIHCIRRNMTILHKAGEVFVSDWVRYADRGSFMPVYSLGKGKDKAAPRRLTESERMKKWRRENPDYVVDQLIRQRKARALKKASRTQAPRPKQEKPQHWKLL